MAQRATNAELCDRYRTLLTHGAAFALTPEQLAATKAWRSELWKQFRELEDRLLPLNVIDRERARNDT